MPFWVLFFLTFNYFPLTEEIIQSEKVKKLDKTWYNQQIRAEFGCGEAVLVSGPHLAQSKN